MITIYDAARCPYCARVRIQLAEKEIEHELVPIDLENRPPWLYEKNPLGRVPVLEEDVFVLPESAVIMEYLEERWPEPPLLPADPAARALARLRIHRFDRITTPYYAVRRGDESARPKLDAALGELDALLAEQQYVTGSEFGLADIAFVPWLLRLPRVANVELDAWPAMSEWIARMLERPSVAAESELVAAL
jgi:glutathione S-transferase